MESKKCSLVDIRSFQILYRMYVFIQLLNSLGLLFEIHHLVNISFLNTVDISVLSVKLRLIQSLVHLGEDECNSLSYYQAFKFYSYTCS